ncbi:hypothetical protein RND71_028948 [Anisodus tanguticus]|uniref:Uncharacterized protein n=1 Tax=Anisodus tanguticus TaxID=243964 RepID=A0AAE1RKR0_9SOLA|nr:hypothetical protein RND71_028948 [Anisodus tanguticus]
MEIIILSKEIVKPSTPTPPNLINHKLCRFDQLALDTCITPIFFYKNNNPLSEINRANIVDNRLKNSLSKTLTLFYPLASELSSENSIFVDCNDNGVLYVDARIKDVRLDEFLQNPDISLLINVLPQNASMSSKMNYVQNLETLVSIQVTRFDCGGVVIGGVLFHKLLDGAAMSKFFNTWAKIARCDDDDGVEKITPLDFTSSSLLKIFLRMKALEGDDALDSIVNMETQVGSLLPELDIYNFSSWCRFGLYDVDFGWGKPIFVAPFIDTIGSLNMQQIILVKNGMNGGIEAWILGNNEEMLELDKDEEFLAYASPNPSVHAP